MDSNIPLKPNAGSRPANRLLEIFKNKHEYLEELTVILPDLLKDNKIIGALRFSFRLQFEMWELSDQGFSELVLNGHNVTIIINTARVVRRDIFYNAVSAAVVNLRGVLMVKAARPVRFDEPVYLESAWDPSESAYKSKDTPSGVFQAAR